MSYLDVYHRALKDYRRNTLQNRECEKQRGVTVKANNKADHVTVVQKICRVETDWVEAIEKGLEHVEKAIREDRQFIRSNGEVVDIEKVRSVSKDSVKHLAEHSDLITRYDEGEDIVPDRLFIVERLNDYAVYENRFLYMLLCYLRDFVTLRYNQIIEIEHTYDGSMEMHKNVHLNKRTISLDVELKEETKDDPYLVERSTSKSIISRIRDILGIVHAFLSMPLMSEVAKVPMIKPPVTRTNVLRMNRNFRGALALYEFVSSYDKPGYVIEEKINNIQPFKADMADEFAEIVMLSSFLTYKHGMGIEADLQKEYEAEEERRREEEGRRLVEQIKDLHRRIAEEGMAPEEYMLLLERRNRALEADREALAVAREEMKGLEAQILDLRREIEQYEVAVTKLNDQIAEMKIAHEEEIRALKEDYEMQIRNLNGSYQRQIAELNAAHETEKATMEAAHAADMENLRTMYRSTMEDLKADCEQKLAALSAAQAAELSALQQKMQEEDARHQAEIKRAEEALQTAEKNAQNARKAEEARVKDLVEKAEQKIKDIEKLYEETLAARRLSDARLTAIRQENGLNTPTDDVMSREAFEEMEHQYLVFKSLFNKEWKKTKKNIRKTTMDAYKEAVKAGNHKEFVRQVSEGIKEGNDPSETISEVSKRTEEPQPTAPVEEKAEEKKKKPAKTAKKPKKSQTSEEIAEESTASSAAEEVVEDPAATDPVEDLAAEETIAPAAEDFVEEPAEEGAIAPEGDPRAEETSETALSEEDSAVESEEELPSLGRKEENLAVESEEELPAEEAQREEETLPEPQETESTQEQEEA